MAKYGISATANINLPVLSDKYNSLQATLRKRFATGLSINAAFTYQHDVGIQTQNVSIPQYFGLNDTTTAIDRTFNLSLGTVYELPFGKGKRFAKSGPLSYIVGGWTLNGLLTRFSGLPFNVTSAAGPCNCPGVATVSADQVLGSVDTPGTSAPRRPISIRWLSGRRLPEGLGLLAIIGFVVRARRIWICRSSATSRSQSVSRFDCAPNRSI